MWRDFCCGADIQFPFFFFQTPSLPVPGHYLPMPDPANLPFQIHGYFFNTRCKYNILLGFFCLFVLNRLFVCLVWFLQSISTDINFSLFADFHHERDYVLKVLALNPAIEDYIRLYYADILQSPLETVSLHLRFGYGGEPADGLLTDRKFPPRAFYERWAELFFFVFVFFFLVFFVLFFVCGFCRDRNGGIF